MKIDGDFSKDLNSYKSEIKSKLLCNTKVSKMFFNDLQNDIDSFIAENNVRSIDDVYKQFGTADDISKSFVDTIDVVAVKKKLNIKRLTIKSQAPKQKKIKKHPSPLTNRN